MPGTTQRRRHGLAGLLVALFVVGGLVFSYGLGHAPPARACTEHAVTAPVGAPTGHATGQTTGQTTGHATARHALQGAVADAAMNVPKPPAHGPAEVCLCLAVLFTLLALGLLAAGLRRPLLRLPARSGWSPALPRGGVPALSPVSSLQVLRL
ncbi:hypothetical protein [Actinomadura litoris]|uniref:hypothetical protein n=1 Tax=Actinomadura litoris TaxID=2678616 RepID=UPI0023430C85|nr:hypothetical protein [Actinomadura litoris]